MNLLKEWRVWGLRFQFGSDYHFPTKTNIKDISNRIKGEKKSEIIFLIWDIFDEEWWVDTGPLINRLGISIISPSNKILNFK